MAETNSDLMAVLATAGKLVDPGLLGGRQYSATAKVEVAAASAANDTFVLCRLPSRARLLGSSLAYWDDLASSGAPTLDIGVFETEAGQLASGDDDDAINDGLSGSTASAGSRVIKTIGNHGLPLWSFAGGQTADPGGQLDVKITLKDAAADTGGTIAVQIDYLLD